MNIHLIINQLPLLKTNHVKAVVSAIAAKAIPVVVLLAMSPVNATPQEALAQLSEKNSVTRYSQLPQIEAPNALEVAQNPKKPKINPPPRNSKGELLSRVCKPDNYINSEKFKGLDGKNYYLVFSRFSKEDPENEVKLIYIIPEDYKEYNKRALPPSISAFVNHNNEFVGYRIESNDGLKEHYDEILLPDSIGNKIIDLVYGDDPYFKYTGWKIHVVNTESTELKDWWAHSSIW